MCLQFIHCSSLIRMLETTQTSVLQKCLLLQSDYEEDFHRGTFTADTWVGWMDSSHGTFRVEERRGIRPRSSQLPKTGQQQTYRQREKKQMHVQKPLGLANFPVISGFRTSWSRFLSGKSCSVTLVDLLSINLLLFTSMCIFYLHEILWLWAL